MGDRRILIKLACGHEWRIREDEAKANLQWCWTCKQMQPKAA